MSSGGMRKILKYRPKVYRHMFQRLQAQVEPVPNWWSAVSEFPPKYHRGQPSKASLKLEFDTDPILRRYLSSDLAKKTKDNEQVNLLENNDNDLGFAYRFADTYVKNNLTGSIDEAATIVSSIMESEKLKFSEQAQKIIDPKTRSVYFKNRPEVKSEHSLWKARLSTTPYNTWVLGARISFDKFISRSLLNMSLSYYTDYRTRRSGMGETNDRYLENVVKEVREGVYGLGEKREEEEEGKVEMTYGEVADKVEELRGKIEGGGGWEEVGEEVRGEVDEFVKGVLFGGEVPRIEGMEEERVLAFARSDVFGLEFEGKETSTAGVEEVTGLDLTPQQMALDTHYEDYSFWHRSYLLEEDLKKQVEDMLSEEEKDLIRQQAKQDQHQYNLSRADRLELICDLWETGQYEVDGSTYRQGMEGWTDTDVYNSRRGPDFERKKKRRIVYEENPLVLQAQGAYDGLDLEADDEFNEFDSVLNSNVEDSIESEEDEDIKIRRYENLEYEESNKPLSYNYKGLEEMERDERGRIKGFNPLFDEDEIDWFKE
ncbi:hypothetical protein TrST_g14324 [Triparma strigata]|uniref:Uncharacterized protein n=1 Tax=Triparma strigata TaxID=1606541 RepID=A0A9W7E249_9STRA|nr:hypothetical protein TrST_g14324 [Triparma strigata]